MRRPFGGSAAAVLIGPSGLNPGAVVTVWDSKVGGTQYTDLQTPDGAAVAGGVWVADNSGVLPDIYGPDNGAGVLWLDGATQVRVLVLSNDLHDRLTTVEGNLADLAAEIAQGAGGGGTAGGIDDGTP